MEMESSLAGTRRAISWKWAWSSRFRSEGIAIAGARLALGAIFLWAFSDKLVGLGFSTPAGKAWIDGVSPAAGFLGRGATGALGPYFNGLAGNPLVDALFMGALFALGVALLLGIGLRLAAIGGAALMTLMWLALVPMKANPAIDDHVVYAFVLLALPGLRAGRRLGLGDWWSRQTFVARHPILE